MTDRTDAERKPSKHWKLIRANEWVLDPDLAKVTYEGEGPSGDPEYMWEALETSYAGFERVKEAAFLAAEDALAQIADGINNALGRKAP